MAMAQGGSKWHPLHTALIFGELDKAKQVFKASGNDPKLLSERNAKGWACLHFAAHSGLAPQVWYAGGLRNEHRHDSTLIGFDWSRGWTCQSLFLFGSMVVAL